MPRLYVLLPIAMAITFFMGCAQSQRTVAPDADPRSSTAMSSQHALIPAPIEVELSSERITLPDSIVIVVDAGDESARRTAVRLSEIMGNAVADMPAVVERADEPSGSDDLYVIRLTRAGADASLGEEGYELEIDGRVATIRAVGGPGLFYGTQTLRQLLPWHVEYEAALNARLTLPTGAVRDAPRYEWRGSMLDVARHFIPLDEVRRYVDHMALYKMNRLHLHLSDDQGWRIEIPGRPRLTEIGAQTEVGGRPGGYFTASEYESLVAYADERFVTIVPEIDMPGHTNAALASYAELNCDDIAREPYVGTSVGFSYLCVEKEETYEFVDDVVRAIAARTTGEYFHLGGDEVHELTPAQYVQFMERAQDIVASHGKRVIGWDEIAEADLTLLPETIVQVWRPQTPETAARVADAVANGAFVILSPADHVYIDMKYDSSTALGLNWAGYNSVRDAYEWEPTELNAQIRHEAILGVEAPLWSETIRTRGDIEYMAFPRLAGVAELGWSPPDRRSWDDYSRRLAAQAPRWSALGINFYRAPEIPWE